MGYIYIHVHVLSMYYKSWSTL